MKKMLGVALVATLAVAPSTLEAQDAAARQHVMRGPAEMILSQRAELGLSADQVARIEAIRDRLVTQNAPLTEQLRAAGVAQGREGMGRRMGGMNAEQRAQMQEHMRSMTPEQRAQMRERMQSMTPEQRAEMHERMQSMTPEQRAEMHQRMGQASPEQRPRMQGRMGQASPEQRAQMQERMRNMTPEQRAQMQERMRNMTPEQRAQMQERMGRGMRGERAMRQVPEEVRPVLQQLRTNQQTAHQEIRAVLTPEQQTRLRELMQQRRGAAHEGMRRGAMSRSSR
jgi:hypothetical protein